MHTLDRVLVTHGIDVVATSSLVHSVGFLVVLLVAIILCVSILRH